MTDLEILKIARAVIEKMNNGIPVTDKEWIDVLSDDHGFGALLLTNFGHAIVDHYIKNNNSNDKETIQ